MRIRPFWAKLYPTFLLLYRVWWVERDCPPRYSGLEWPTAPATDDRETEHLVERKLARETNIQGTKHVTLSFCPQQMPQRPNPGLRDEKSAMVWSIFLAYSSTVNMEALSSCETYVNYQSTRCNIPDDPKCAIFLRQQLYHHIQDPRENILNISWSSQNCVLRNS
jgi:hypothetical protein